MRWLLVGSLLVAGVALAGPSFPPPPPVKRKPLTDKYPAEAIEPFVEAVLADKAGNLRVAQSRYETSAQRSNQANTYYNLADVQRRMERWTQAVKSYEKYLELAPDAPDRAEVERLIAQIQGQPGTAVIDGDDPDAVVFVDGKLIGSSPVVLPLPDGSHTAHRITATGHAQRTFTMRPASHNHITLNINRPEPGNVILSGNISYSGSWSDNGHEYRFPGRMALAPGRHTTYLINPTRACSPLAFDAPKPDELVYVWVEAPRTPSGCLPIKITQTKVRFSP